MKEPDRCSTQSELTTIGSYVRAVNCARYFRSSSFIGSSWSEIAVRATIKFFNNVILWNETGERNHASKHSSRFARNWLIHLYSRICRPLPRVIAVFNACFTVCQPRKTSYNLTKRRSRLARSTPGSMKFRKRISWLNGPPRNYSFWHLGLTVELNTAVL